MSSARPRSADHRRRARGLSLLEALAATAFVGIALLGFAANTISLTRNQKAADSTSVASALVVHKLEQLRSMPLGAAQLVQGSYQDAANPMQADGSLGGIFTRTWTVSANDQPTWGLKTVIVTVTWRDPATHLTRVAAYVRCSTVPCP